MAEPYKWITIQGKHIPVFHGEDGNDVFGVGEEYKEWTDADAKREYQKYDYDVTSKEWREATKYTGGQYYTAIQRALYSGQMRQSTYSDGVKDMSPYIEAIDDSMRPLSENIEVSRSVSVDNWENSIGLDINTIQGITEAGDNDLGKLDAMVGKEFTPKGYTSTSYQESQNATQGGQVLMKIKVPKGTDAIVTANKAESEIILHRNLRYKITGYYVRTVAGTRKQIVVEAIVLE